MRRIIHIKIYDGLWNAHLFKENVAHALIEMLTCVDYFFYNEWAFLLLIIMDNGTAICIIFE